MCVYLADRTSIPGFQNTHRKVSSSVRSLLTLWGNAVQLRMNMPVDWGASYCTICLTVNLHITLCVFMLCLSAHLVPVRCSQCNSSNSCSQHNSTQLNEHVRMQVLTPQCPHLFNTTTYETTRLLLHVLIYLQFRLKTHILVPHREQYLYSPAMKLINTELINCACLNWFDWLH